LQRCNLCCVAWWWLQDVPAALNGLLDSLPSKVSIQGLPFDAVFTYALYTLNYVIVKVSKRDGLQQALQHPVAVRHHCSNRAVHDTAASQWYCSS
jgi:hypothetical protein